MTFDTKIDSIGDFSCRSLSSKHCVRAVRKRESHVRILVSMADVDDVVNKKDEQNSEQQQHLIVEGHGVQV